MYSSYHVGFPRPVVPQSLRDILDRFNFKSKFSPDQTIPPFEYFRGETDTERVITFYYNGMVENWKYGGDVEAAGELVTPEMNLGVIGDLQRRIESVRRAGKKISRIEYYERVIPERQVYYAIALALRDEFNATVISSETREEIKNPDDIVFDGKNWSLHLPNNIGYRKIK